MKTSQLKTAISKSSKPASNNFPIVAIGASAGGLEAMMILLSNIPYRTGMAFIYVQHLSPEHKSMLTEILSKKTRMKVQEIDDMEKIQPNNVFVIPYNKAIEVKGNNIKLIPRSESTTAISIDVLFSSLAHAHKSRVIGIVLSGSASDGTIGLQTIKQEGGLTFAQDDSAKFNSMPHSAIAAGAVDYILSPEEIARELGRISKHPLVKPKVNIHAEKEDEFDHNHPDFKAIISLLQTTKNVDFSAYKKNTIKRRIIRRMVLYKLATISQYVKLLKKNNEEIEILYQDLLINVTSFFRDTDTHKYLKQTLFPKLLKQKKTGESVRIWIPACATGEEAYSIAMIFLEIQENKTTQIPIKIFATDLSERAIEKARIGIYTKQELETVSPKRIQRFFTKSEGNFRVNKDVRNMCVFAPHNLLRDAPFSKLDFISCCNLFIYFDTAAQKQAVNTFHYALNNDGILMLGKSENITHSANLFTEIDKTYKIYLRNKNGIRKLPSVFPSSGRQAMTTINTPEVSPDKMQKLDTKNPHVLDNAIDAVLVSSYMPASVVINHQMEIVQFRGTTDLFLTHPKGKASLNIMNLARPEFALELRASILHVIKTGEPVTKSAIEIKVNEAIRVVSIDVAPLNIVWDEPLLIIIFKEQQQVEVYGQTAKGAKNVSLAKDRRIKSLEDALSTANANALSITIEQEMYTEELQSANEEVISSNEELQTVNEELETSKEEIESANEELTSANQELQTRNDLLSESYEFAEAIVSTMHEPMVVLDKGLRVKSANKAFYEKFKVTEEQTEGILLYDLGNKQWDIPALRNLLEDIIPKNAQFYNYEVKHTFLDLGPKMMSLNASRIIQKAHREQLILLVIADITEVRNLLIEKESIEKELLNTEIRNRKDEKIRLEKAVEERTLELKKANESLKEKNTALININKELEAFTYVSSHDLQEPVRKIQTFVSLILDKEHNKLSEKGKDYFRHMQQAAQRMQQLIRDLLAFSRISETDRKFENMDLKTIIDEVKAGMKEVIAQKKAIIAVGSSCKINIITFQFRQLMNNLISNAIKFSKPEAPPEIIINSRHIKYDELNVPNLPFHKEYCHITVSDNGIGFEKEFSDKIFEVFQKLHGKDEYEGTGIGLAIVKKIVDNHHGVITATGTLNKGATFDIYIPALLKN